MLDVVMVAFWLTAEKLVVLIVPIVTIWVFIKIAISLLFARD